MPPPYRFFKPGSSGRSLVACIGGYVGLSRCGYVHHARQPQQGNRHSIIEEAKKMMIYNCTLHEQDLKHNWMQRKVLDKKRKRQEFRAKMMNKKVDIPVALKYLHNLSGNVAPASGGEEEEPIHLPYHVQEGVAPLPGSGHDDVGKHTGCAVDSEEDAPCQSWQSPGAEAATGNWMSDYECYDENVEAGRRVSQRPWQLNYGTPDAKYPISKVPCGGCGALLHCQDPAIPGYLPSELFVHRSDAELRSLACQRCHFLTTYGIALNVNVSTDEYPRLLAHIQDKRALVILIVDVTDFPCSVWPDVVDIIGTKRPVVVAANKVDLLPQDGPSFLDHLRGSLKVGLQQTCLADVNVKHVALISATTGFGVEELITKLHNIWEYQGDVYLMGCTNVGKSSLFNALLQSDYCKVKAVDLMRRATTSPWPGTTLNLLKFPILRPAGWRLYRRMQRLIHESRSKEGLCKLRAIQLSKTRDLRYTALIGHIGRTFMPVSRSRRESDPFSVTPSPYGGPRKMVGLDPSDKDFQESRWCYDTPGTVQPDQVINLLTTQELMLTLPKSLLVPRTFYLKPGNTLFVAGLGRLDFLEGDEPARFTVFASTNLPVTVCLTEDATQLYSTVVGSELFRVPCGGAERMAKWPGLKPHPRLLEVEGKGWKETVADVVLSSAGWVAVTPGLGASCRLRAWTPYARGVHLRQPPFLQRAGTLHGARVRGSPAYRTEKAACVPE